MPCSICQSFEHLVVECPTIPTEPSEFLLEAKATSVHATWPTIVNLNKVMGDFVGDHKSINAQLSQRIDSNPKGIHEVEAQEGESSQVREVKAVITLRSGKEVDLPTSKPEHESESETE
ncbi:hypothetical protein AAG906_016689 [Vitis piasezkii]